MLERKVQAEEGRVLGRDRELLGHARRFELAGLVARRAEGRGVHDLIDCIFVGHDSRIERPAAYAAGQLSVRNQGGVIGMLLAQYSRLHSKFPEKTVLCLRVD